MEIKSDNDTIPTLMIRKIASLRRYITMASERYAYQNAQHDANTTSWINRKQIKRSRVPIQNKRGDNRAGRGKGGTCNLTRPESCSRGSPRRRRHGAGRRRRCCRSRSWWTTSPPPPTGRRPTPDRRAAAPAADRRPPATTVSPPSIVRVERPRKP